MKIQRVFYRVATVMTAFALGANVSVAEGRRHEHRGQHRLPPDIAKQLNAEQIAQLETAPDFKSRRELLQSWGIQTPARHHEKGPPSPPEYANSPDEPGIE